MKYTLIDTLGSVCKQSGIKRLWMVEVGDSPLASSDLSNLPEVKRLHDAERSVLSAAADAKLHQQMGICVYPSLNTVFTTVPLLHELHRNHVPMLVIALVDQYDATQQKMCLSILEGCGFYVNYIHQASNFERELTATFQETIASWGTSVLLIDKSLLDDTLYERQHRFKLHRTLPTVIPSNESILEIAELLNGNQKITLLCGASCQEALTEIDELSHLLNAPIVYQPGVMHAKKNHLEYSIGELGRWSDPAAHKAVSECDLLFLLDYTPRQYCVLKAGQTVVHITPTTFCDVDMEVRKRLYRGDIRLTIQQLLPHVHAKEGASFLQDQLSSLKRSKEEHDHVFSAQTPLVKEFLHQLESYVAHDTLLVAHGYLPHLLKYSYVRKSLHPTLFLSDEIYNRGGVIYEAIGLQAGNNGKPVIVIIDSEELLQDLGSIFQLSQENIPIKILYVNQETHGLHAGQKYTQMCKQMGISFFHIRTTEHVEEHIQDWLTHPHLSMLQVDGFAIPYDLLIDTVTSHKPLLTEKFLKQLCQLKVGDTEGTLLYNQRDQKLMQHLDCWSMPVIELQSMRAMAYAAMAAYHQNQRVPICLIHTLNDLLNMLPGLLEARRNRIPMTCLVFYQHGCSIYSQKDMLLLVNLLSSISVHNYVAGLEHKDLNSMVGEAIAEAHNKHGISTVMIEEKIVEEIAPQKEYTPPFSFSETYPNDKELQKIAAILNESKATVVFAGAGALDAHREVISLTRKIKAPLGWTNKAKDHFDYDNHYPIGMNGLLANPALMDAYRKCEVLLLLGANMPVESQLPKSTKIIQIDIDPRHLGIPQPVDIGVVGDIRTTLQHLYPLLVTMGDDSFAECSTRSYRKGMENYREQVVARAKLQEHILADYLFMLLNDHLPKNAWITSDMFMPWYQTALNIESKGERRLFLSGDSRFTSNSTAFTLGVIGAEPDRHKVILCTNLTLYHQLDNIRPLLATKEPIKILVLHLPSDGKPVFYSELPYGEEYLGLKVSHMDKLEEVIHQLAIEKGPVIVDIPTRQEDLNKAVSVVPYYVEKYKNLLKNMYSTPAKEEAADSTENFKGHL